MNYFENIDLVTGGFSLTAFLIAAILHVVIQALKREKELIKTADSDAKASLVESALDKLHIPVDNLTREQKYNLVVKKIDQRTKLWLFIFGTLVCVSAIAAVVTIATLQPAPSPSPLDLSDSGPEAYLEEKEFIEGQEAYFFTDDREENKVKAFKAYKKSAESGNPFGFAALAKLYYRGYGTPKDEEKAKYWATLAVEELEKEKYENTPWAMYSKAYMYENGLGVLQDKKKALELYEVAAIRDNFIAQGNLSSYYKKGDTINADIPKAISLLKQAIKSSEGKYSSAYLSLGDTYYYRNYGIQDFVEAGKHYKKAAEKGSFGAIYKLGEMAYWGQGRDKDLEKAFNYFNDPLLKNYDKAQLRRYQLYKNRNFSSYDDGKALSELTRLAEEDHGEANYLLALVYNDPDGVAPNTDEEKAVAYMQKSVTLKYYEANLTLAYWHMNGRAGLAKNINTGLELIQQAANEEYIPAYVELGKAYFFDRYALNDYAQSEKWLRKAVAHDNTEAISMLYRVLAFKRNPNRDVDAAFKLANDTLKKHEPLGKRMLAYSYANSIGTEMSHERAETLFIEAYELGDTGSAHQLARLYDHGDWALDGKEKKAHEWHLTAVKYGNNCAMNSVGVNYLEGKGTKQDYKLALKYFLMAEKFNDNAKFNLGRIYEKGLGVTPDLDKAMEYYARVSLYYLTDAQLGIYRLYSNPAYSGNDADKANDYLIKAAAGGSVKAKKALIANMTKYEEAKTCQVASL